MYFSHFQLYRSSLKKDGISKILFPATGVSVVLAVTKLDMIMCWYSLPELAFPLYIFPLLIAGCATHAILAQLHKVFSYCIFIY